LEVVGIVFAFILLGGCLYASVRAYQYAAQAIEIAAGSVPAKVKAASDEATRSVAEISASVQQDLESKDARMTAWHADIEAVLDAVEDVLARTERKRRQTTSAAARLENGGDQVAPANELEALKASARARGMTVL